MFILNALLECNTSTEQIEAAFEEAISYYESQNILDKVSSFLEDLETFYKNNKRNTELRSTRIRIARTEKKLLINMIGKIQKMHIILSLIFSQQ